MSRWKVSSFKLGSISFKILLLSGSFHVTSVLAQNGWLPPSREMERPFALRTMDPSIDMHTAIRPWRLKDLRSIPADTSIASVLPLLDRWADTSRTFRWGPLIDASGGFDADQELAFYRAGAGAWMDADAGSKWNFHLDGQVWSEQFPGYLDHYAFATQVTPGEGYAFGNWGGDRMHYDWNGHISWDPGKFFNLTLGRGKNSFGEGHRSLFLSTEAQGYPYLRITTSVWKVKYVNLFSMMNDLRNINDDPLNARKKYSAMHYLSWNATRRINVAIFEAIVFDPGNDAYPRGFDINYLNPIIFYRPVEFNQGSPDNALLGASINVKAGRSNLIYSQFMLDEFLWFHVRNGTGWYGNKQALQLGVIARNAFKVDGLSLRGEWNYIRPFMYSHVNNVQNYAHFGQPLAHPYGSNVSEVIAHADLERGRFLYSVRGSMAWMGTDSVDSYGNNIFRSEGERPRTPDNVPVSVGFYHGHWHPVSLLHVELRAGYLLDRSTATRLEVSYLFRSKDDVFLPATDHIFRFGISTNFRDRHLEQDARYFLR